MSKIAITIETRPAFRNVKGQFDKATKDNTANIRREMQVQGRRLVALLQEEAPRKTGKFAKGIRYNTYVESGGKTAVGIEVRVPQPIGSYIIKGTRPHPIRARKAKALFFHWGKIGANVVVPKSGGFSTHFRNGTLWVGKGYVSHPGTKANRFEERAWRKWLPGGHEALRRITREFITDFGANK